MFLKEPEINFVQISNNGNHSNGQFQTTSWENEEVHTLPVPVDESYENFIDIHGNHTHVPCDSDTNNLINHVEPNEPTRFLERINIENIVNENSFVEYSEAICNNSNFARISNIPIKRQNSSIYSEPENREVDENIEELLSDACSVRISKNNCYDSNEDILFHYEETDRSCSTSDVSPQDENEKMFEASDSEDSYIQDNETHPLPRGIHNPNYPGFQHLAYTLQDYSVDTPNSYENSLFSNVYICCKDEEELLQLTLSNNINQGEETNNNIDYIEDSEYLKTQESYEKSIAWLDNKGISDNPQISVQTTENNYLQSIDDTYLNDQNEEIFNDNSVYMHGSLPRIDDDNNELDQQIEIANDQDEVIALRQEIYEIIEKPIANTVDNISEVVNTVIKHIVEYQQKFNIDVWNTLTREKILLDSPKKILHDDENLEYIKETSCDSKNVTPKTTSKIINIDMDDAYMTNVTEELFHSPIENRFPEIFEDEDHTSEENAECSKPSTEIAKHNSIDNNLNRIRRKNDCLKEDSSKNSQPKISIEKSTTIKEFCENKKHKSATDSKTWITKNTCKKAYKKEHPDRKKISSENIGSGDGFDVYNIETAMPLIDLDAIESHLRAAREEERRRRNDREEIRRRLALGAEMDEYYPFAERPSRKPSLQARLQSGMNLQICFMNETASDADSPLETESVDKDRSYEDVSNAIENKCDELLGMSTETTKVLLKSDQSNINNNKVTKGLTRPSSLALNDTARPAMLTNLSTQAAFFECQARLQTEARMALAQAKELAHMQMEIDRKKQESSPITEMLRVSLQKAGVELTGDRRRVSRQMLTDMNVTQLQVIVNELHTQIEYLNESLVKLLIARDELHMGQDSMLVDIEDLTRYLSAKEISVKLSNDNEMSPSTIPDEQNHLKSHLSSLTSLLTK